MYLNSEINLKLVKFYLDSSKVYLNLKRLISEFHEIQILTFLNSDTFLLN